MRARRIDSLNVNGIPSHSVPIQKKAASFDPMVDSLAARRT